MDTIFNRMKNKKGFTVLELLVVIAIVGVLSAAVMIGSSVYRTRSQDSKRVSEIRQIQYALALYFNDFGKYPTCLYTGGGCTTVLNGTSYMKTVPKDPLGINYTYAALGSGTNCTSYHLGVSLADKSNKALQSGADAPAASVCTGSAVDFSGLSYNAPGSACNTVAGTAQPTGAANGETCYDVRP